MDWEVRSLGAIVQAWYPGQEGGTAVADVLFGNYNPAGRLPVTFYRSTEDLPPFEDYRMANRTYRFFGGKVLFPFGYGLSYTSFGYSGLSATYDGEAIRVSVAVRNTGGLDGDEVVQIYARSMDSKVAQPIRRLFGFKRVGVPRGESVMVDLIISSRELRYWDEQKGEYAVAAGIYEIEAGASSGDIRLRERLAVS